MKSFTKIVLLSAIMLTACAKTVSPEESNTAPESEVPKTVIQEQKDTIRETPNVTYTGTVAPAGISIYQEGSHRLVLEDDRFVLLESDSIDLNGYVDEKVKATGSVRPTVEEGGMLMTVENIQLVEPETEKKPAEKEDSAPEAEPTAEPIKEEKPTVKTETRSSAVEEEPSEDTSDEVVSIHEEAPVSAAFAAIIESMAKDDYSPERWTQPDYCTGHIGFCVPIHKNWWYKSFGNTSSYLWHLELSNQAVNALGEGPISVNLVSGSIGSKKATENQVRIQGDLVIGFHSWDDNTHFEIVADKSLENAVRYITQELSRYQE